MNIVESFVEYIENLGLATFGQDLFIGQAPSSNVVPDAIYWVTSSGGAPEIRLPTGATVKNYQVDIFYRDRDYQTVYNSIHDLEEELNCAGCTQLTGFETFDIQATTFPIDNDLDSESRKVGLVQATLKVYKGC